MVVMIGGNHYGKLLGRFCYDGCRVLTSTLWRTAYVATISENRHLPGNGTEFGMG